MNNPKTSSNAWFSEKICYKGYGHAEFVNPPGFIEGPVVIDIGQNGLCKAHMRRIKKFRNEDDQNPPAGGLHHLLTGVKPKALGDMRVWGVGLDGASNICKRLEVKVKNPPGIFISENLNCGFMTADSPILFFPSSSEFEVSDAGPAKFWILPLSNFLFDFVESETSYNAHPMRIDSSNAWMRFEFGGETAFIEPLINYAELDKKLCSKRVSNAITSVMVADIGKNPVTSESIFKWLPDTFFPALLSLATNTEVRATWIEFRDARGELVKRVHRSWGNQNFFRGQASISSFHDGGLGNLLTNSQHADYSSSRIRDIRIAIYRLVKSRISDASFTFEDKYSYLCRAYEKFSEDVAAPQPKAILGDEYYGRLEEQIEATQSKIRGLAKAIKDMQGDTEESEARIDLLTRIEGRMSHTLDINLSFGELVIGLAKQHGLADPEVMGNFYGSEKAWGRKLTGAYRAKVMHGSYFDFASKDHTVREVTLIMYHLHDLLVRILLKILGYNGSYRPSIWESPPDCSVNWVVSTLSPQALGYESIHKKT